MLVFVNSKFYKKFSKYDKILFLLFLVVISSITQSKDLDSSSQTFLPGFSLKCDIISFQEIARFLGVNCHSA